MDFLLQTGLRGRDVSRRQDREKFYKNVRQTKMTHVQRILRLCTVWLIFSCLYCLQGKTFLRIYKWLSEVGRLSIQEYHRFIRNRVEMFGKSHPWFLLGLDRGKRRLPSIESSSSTEEKDSGKRRLSSIESAASLSAEIEKKKVKRTESIVQVPVPVKPITGSSSLLSLGTGLSMSAAARLHPPRHSLSSHTASSAILGHSLHVGETMTTRAPIATRSHLVTSCPVKLYPWKPNMYLV